MPIQERYFVGVPRAVHSWMADNVASRSARGAPPSRGASGDTTGNRSKRVTVLRLPTRRRLRGGNRWLRGRRRHRCFGLAQQVADVFAELLELSLQRVAFTGPRCQLLFQLLMF